MNLAIELQQEHLDKIVGLMSLGQGLVPPEKARLLVTEKNGYLHVDEERLDLFTRSDIPIPEWEPKHKLTAYSALSKVYLDIETKGGDINLITSLKCPTVQDLKDARSLESRGFFDPRSIEIKMIGIRNERGDNVYIRDSSEAGMLQYLFDILKAKQPDLLLTFNGMKFDLPVVIAKANLLGIKHNFFVSDYTSTFRTAMKFGSPEKFNAIYLKYGNRQCHHIDLYQQALAYDFVARKIVSYSLKSIPLEMGLRKEARLDLGYAGLLDCYERGDAGDESAWKAVEEYLGFDLEDTELIANELLPSIYYQLLFVTEFKLQSLSTMGNATKWQSVLNRETKGVYDRESNTVTLPSGKTLHTNPKKSFQGGLTGGFALFLRNVSKIDVASLYPSVMLAYGICSKKDTDRISLAILFYCKTVRIGFKTLKNLLKGDYTGDPVSYARTNHKAVQKCLQFCIYIGYFQSEINDLRDLFDRFISGDLLLSDLVSFLKTLGSGFFRNEGSLKIFINSGYGFLAATGVVFNDPEGAALVTSYSRRILTFMLDFTKANGGIIGGCDTDGLMMASGTFELNEDIYKKLQKALPQWIEIDKEFDADFLFVPPMVTLDKYNKSYAWTTKAGKQNAAANNLFYKTFSYEITDEFLENDYLSADPEVVNKAYLWMIQNYGAAKVHYEQFIEVADRFGFDFPNNAGKKKNYIYETKGQIKTKGRFNKRDKNILDKTFQIEYLKLHKVDPDAAKDFYSTVRESLILGTYPIKDLAVTRKIRKGEVTLVNEGLGQIGDVVNIYRSITSKYAAVGSGKPYDTKVYLGALDLMWSELQTVFIITDNMVKKQTRELVATTQNLRGVS